MVPLLKIARSGGGGKRDERQGKNSDAFRGVPNLR